MELIKSLTNIGLSDKEAKVYLALLPYQKATAYLMAQRSGLKKPTTYVILENLVNKGFALKTPQKDKHYFMAKPPKECIAIAKGKLNDTEDALPQLEALQKKNDEKVSVSYFEGIEGMKEMYRRFFKESTSDEVVGFFGHTKNAAPELIKIMSEIKNEVRERKISFTGITPKEELNHKIIESLGKNLATIKTIPIEKYNSNISIEAHDDFVHIMSFRHLQGIIIKNKDIADAIRQIAKLTLANIK